MELTAVVSASFGSVRQKSVGGVLAGWLAGGHTCRCAFAILTRAEAARAPLWWPPRPVGFVAWSGCVTSLRVVFGTRATAFGPVSRRNHMAKGRLLVARALLATCLTAHGEHNISAPRTSAPISRPAIPVQHISPLNSMRVRRVLHRCCEAHEPPEPPDAACSGNAGHSKSMAAV